MSGRPIVWITNGLTDQHNLVIVSLDLQNGLSVTVSFCRIKIATYFIFRRNVQVWRTLDVCQQARIAITRTAQEIFDATAQGLWSDLQQRTDEPWRVQIAEMI